MQASARNLPHLPEPHAGPMRVLLVDDDPIHRETARMFLHMYGRQVTLGANGTEGLAHAASGAFDILIVDLEMPDMTGLEVIQRIRQMPRHRDLPIIMVTSRDDAMAIDRAYELGASSFVVKPVNWTLLDHYIRFVCRAAGNEVAARRAHAEIEALAATKDNLLAVVRHEMKTPLNAILGFTRLAAEAQGSGDVGTLVEQLAFVRESGERLLACFGDMAVYSDLISRRAAFSPEIVPAAWILDEALEHRGAALAKAGIAVEVDIRIENAKIRADQSLLAAAMVRILDNVLKHAGGATSVKLVVGRRGEDIAFEIADDGAGMAAERIATCLQPFSQENMSRARLAEGLGLGLPIAVEIIRLHGGRLDMHSASGMGVRVEIRLPQVTA
jgi:signal transduction histidine kinase